VFLIEGMTLDEICIKAAFGFDRRVEFFLLSFLSLVVFITHDAGPKKKRKKGHTNLLFPGLAVRGHSRPFAFGVHDLFLKLVRPILLPPLLAGTHHSCK